MKLKVNKKEAIIYPDNNRIIARFFFTNVSRAEKLIEQILAIPEQDARSLFAQNLREFSKRHRSITGIYKKHYNSVKDIVARVHKGNSIPEWKRLLIGSYFTMEYAVESAALFNPSIVEDIDQTGLEEGQVRILLSLRATGEGHISSLIFRRAVVTEDDEILLDEPGLQIAEAEIIKDHIYKKRSFVSKLDEMGLEEEFYNLVLNKLPEKFTHEHVRESVKKVKQENDLLLLEHHKALNEIIWLADSYTEVKFSLDTDITERVIFPISKYEQKGIEDARFVKFTGEDGQITYYGTYTAYDGHTILPRLIETRDFYTFKTFPLHGNVAVDKNFALFPRKINGKYAMISRINGYSNYIMFSEKINWWSEAELLQEPIYPWELVQIGNGGSPIETEKGWLLITHGVGPVRRYCLGACLLDLENPRIIKGRLKQPLLVPVEDERSGYVPNVVYTCGTYLHKRELIIPYAMSDYATSFASIDIDYLLDNLTMNE